MGCGVRFRLPVWDTPSDEAGRAGIPRRLLSMVLNQCCVVMTSIEQVAGDSSYC